mgnify:FL=1
MGSKQFNNIDVIKLALFYIGYVTLLGPPRAISMFTSRSEHELLNKPLWVTCIAELSFRGCLFIVLGFTMELLLGDVVFVKLHGNDFLIFLLAIGLLHMLSYYIGVGIIAPTNLKLGMFLYRLGRNEAYALVCALVVVLCVLFYQHIHQIKLFSGTLVEKCALITFLIFSLIGFFEAIFTKRNVASTLNY